jgi:hypothetical protein
MIWASDNRAADNTEPRSISRAESALHTADLVGAPNCGAM